MIRKVLVCGGAGYIGSHMVRQLLAAGHEVVVLDDLSTGHVEAVGDAELVQAGVNDTGVLERLFQSQHIDAVMHFCAHSLVGESMQRPLDYYWNNVAGTLSLLQAMQRHDVSRLVFSSTAAVYGVPKHDRIDESHPTEPINPYGRSKLMVERTLKDAAEAHGLRSVSLRYFNAAGASPTGDIGESHEPETHLIPNILKAAQGAGGPLKLFGDDYPTPDGTCVRDYIHVDDLAQAHLAALDWMDGHEGAQCFNLGNGRGFSVLEIIRAAEEVTDTKINYSSEARRPGDPAILVASARKAMDELGWAPRHTRIEDIIETAWRWHQNQRF